MKKNKTVITFSQLLAVLTMNFNYAMREEETNSEIEINNLTEDFKEAERNPLQDNDVANCEQKDLTIEEQMTKLSEQNQYLYNMFCEFKEEYFKSEEKIYNIEKKIEYLNNIRKKQIINEVEINSEVKNTKKEGKTQTGFIDKVVNSVSKKTCEAICYLTNKMGIPLIMLLCLVICYMISPYFGLLCTLFCMVSISLTQKLKKSYTNKVNDIKHQSLAPLMLITNMISSTFASNMLPPSSSSSQKTIHHQETSSILQ